LTESTSRLADEIASLKASLEQQRLRLDMLESTPGNGNGDTHSRRNLLKLAGAGLVGAAGAAALRVLPASAATGGNFILGGINQADKISVLRLTAETPSGGTVANTSALQVDSTNALTLLSGTMRGIEAIGQGTGAGVAGMSWSGPGGFFGSTNGPDLQLGGFTINFVTGGKTVTGTGRLAQMMDTSVGAVGPGTAPAAGIAEILRGSDASLWASTTAAAWRRMNSLRVDKSDGSGSAFTPARIFDTRSATGPTAGAALNGGQTYKFGPYTGTKGIPADAIGIVGNLTVVDYTGAGYIAIFPGGLAWPGNSSVNFGPPFAASGWANFFVVGFGSGADAGKISLYLSSNGIKSHAVVDVLGYLQ